MTLSPVLAFPFRRAVLPAVLLALGLAVSPLRAEDAPPPKEEEKKDENKEPGKADDKPQPAANPKKADEESGQVFEQYQLTKRMFKKPRDYFSKSLGEKNLEKFYEATETSAKQRQMPLQKPAEALEYPIDEQSAFLRVPKSYDKQPGWGLYIHIGNDRKAGKLPPGWRGVLDERKYLYAAPNGVQDAKSDIVRVAIALDTLATVQGEYAIDPKRVVIGGERSGGAVAMIAALNYPAFFRGAVSHRYALILQRTLFGDSAKTGGTRNVNGQAMPETNPQAWTPEVPYLGTPQYKQVEKAGIRFVLYTGGPKSFDLERVLRAAPLLLRAGLTFKVFDLQEEETAPLCPADAFGEALGWIEGEAVDDLKPPRYSLYGGIRMPEEPKEKTKKKSAK